MPAQTAYLKAVTTRATRKLHAAKHTKVHGSCYGLAWCHHDTAVPTLAQSFWGDWAHLRAATASAKRSVLNLMSTLSSCAHSAQCSSSSLAHP